MSDPETKYKHSTHRKHNLIAKTLRDSGEHKGAFAMKIIDSRKQEYKRQKLRVEMIEMDYDE